MWSIYDPETNSVIYGRPKGKNERRMKEGCWQFDIPDKYELNSIFANWNSIWCKFLWDSLMSSVQYAVSLGLVNQLTDSCFFDQSQTCRIYCIWGLLRFWVLKATGKSKMHKLSTMLRFRRLERKKHWH